MTGSSKQFALAVYLVATWLLPSWADDLVIDSMDSLRLQLLFEQTCLDAIDRVRRATAGRADVLLCTTCPSVERWETMAAASATDRF